MRTAIRPERMKRKRLGGTEAVAALIFIAAALSAQAKVPPAPTLAQADAKFAQKSYTQALKAYETLQKVGQVPPARQDEIAYRVAVSLGKAQQWDRALAGSLDFVKTHRNTIWEPRGLYWLGRLYLLTPHQGYRVGNRTFRGQNVPPAQGDDKPVYVELSERDQRNALDALEAAHILTARLPAPTTPAAINDRGQLDFDLIHVLQQGEGFSGWAQKQNWLPPNDASWQIDTTQTYDPAWPQPKKTLYLYKAIRDFAPAAPHSAALGQFGEALWLRQYQAQMRRYTLKLERDKWINIPYPYQDIQPGALLGDLVKQYPNDSLRDQAQYLQAIWLTQDGKLTAGLQAFRQVVAQRPRSKWASDARAQIAALLRPGVSFANNATTRPGQSAKLQLTTRNARRAHLEIYRIDLPELLMRRAERRQDTNGNEEQPDWSQLDTLLHKAKTLPAALQASGAQRMSAWDVDTRDKGDLKAVQQTVTIPVRAAGAYVVVASVPGQRYAALLPITDLTLVQKLDRDNGLYYVTDAASGKPQANVNVWVRQSWQTTIGSKQGKAPRQKTHVLLTRATTNGDGLLTVPILRGADRSDYQLAAVAYVGGRFALVTPQRANDNVERAQTEYRAYCTTDRAVYRPQQIVYFRSLLMRRQSSADAGRNAFAPLAGKIARVQITDAKGNLVHKQRSACDAFGAVSGQFTLPKEAPLGEYSISLTLPQTAQDAPELNLESAGDKFRVEEYKKPEFEVMVTPTAERVKLGQPTKAKIHAAYYFGGPVPGASVTYRVYRNTYAASYRFPQPYDYLYNNEKSGRLRHELSERRSGRAGQIPARRAGRCDDYV